MQEIIRITKQGSKDTVNARELHEFLEVQTRFNDWIRSRIEKYGFVERTDYILLTEKLVSGNNAVSKEYYITIDMAKELCMVENNDKGRQARLYFIECENRLRQQMQRPMSLEEMTIKVIEGQKERIEYLESKVTEYQPKVDFYNSVASSDSTFDMSEVAKVLGLKKGNVTLFRILRKHKIIMENNEPYQEYVSRRYFKLVEYSYLKNGSVKVGKKTVVLQKGIDFISKLIGKHYPTLMKAS